MKYCFSFPWGRLSSLLVILLFPAFIFSGCIHDDNDDCPTGVFLRFSYVLNSRFTCLFSQQVNNLAVYVYQDSTFELLKKLDVGFDELSSGNRLHLDLPAGNYRVVVWGNPDTRYYSWADENSYDSFRLSALCDGGGRVPSSLGSLFYGACNLRLKQYNNAEQPVEMIKNTNRIRVLIEKHTGVPSVSIFERYAVNMSGSNGCYDICNANVSTSGWHYPAECMTAPEVEVDFTVLRLAENDDLTLTVSHAITGEVFDAIPVVQELMLHPHINSSEDLDRYDEYLLRYELNETNGLVLLGVNDWTVAEQGGGI
ncbi:FimB/Mfa2 family fimbrial subunit [Bacteroides sp. 224]|uniref:FimB/Mfa2 family fimbrial subunit n=1 Tax=Bacteroides sp. 224 TaxID=2302936 RepID=UPI0013D0CF9A|nr:FimB/Mfa2 family fimbrial subunit [Bacteroides sp. 224]NDV66420.1 hypothetical protein [Bacteroides sp. 224]